MSPAVRLAPLLAVLLAACASTPAPLPAHVERDLHGWTVEVDRRLVDGANAELGRRALERLDADLLGVATVLPPERVAELRSVRIRVDLDSPLGRPQYHPSRAWLVEHGHDPTLEKRVHVPQAAPYLDLAAKNWQPWAVLHELAHAYHDQVLGWNDPSIEAAYARVKASGQYESVPHIQGGMHAHYALTDPRELFAEMTECYFGTNDFWPFVRAELERADPETYALLAEIWGPLPR
jgi:hypothetical protein